MAREKTDQEKHPERYFINPVGHVKDRIIINENPDIPKNGLFISLNGYGFLAKTGVEIDIPRPVREMLDTRIQSFTTRDDETKQEHTRNFPRITYILVKKSVNFPEGSDAVYIAKPPEKEIFPPSGEKPDPEKREGTQE
jgi:hypothetical protein